MTIIIVEFNTWHGECLYSHCLLYKRMGYSIILCTTTKQEKLAENLQSNNVIDKYELFEFSRRYKKLTELWRFRRFVLNSQANHLHLNTAQGSFAWKLFLLPIPKRIIVTGILHNIRKVKSSLGQYFISRRINGYILLSDILKPEYIASKCKVTVEAVYTIFKPNIKSTELDKPQNEIWLCVPGAISYKRRDYDILLEKEWPENIKFIFLCNRHKEDGDVFYKKVEITNPKLMKNFVFFDKYIPDELFDAYILKSDALLPLVHPWNNSLAQYIKTKISGTYNLSVQYKKLMLCPQSLMGIGNIANIAIAYSDDRFADYVSSLTKEAFDSKDKFTAKKWSEEYQSEQLTKFISLISQNK